ncbi:hypothetical protein Tco_0189606 [Tanacetum coccineum]
MKRRLFKGRVETSTDKSLGEDASKQGRYDDKTEKLNLTDRADTKVIVEDKGTVERGGSTADQVSTARPEVSAASVPVNAQRLHEEELAELDRAQKERQKQEEATKQEKYTIEERARLLAEFFERRKKQLAAERAEAIRNKPPTRTQVRNRMITYIKHMVNSKQKALKRDQEQILKKEKVPETYTYKRIMMLKKRSLEIENMDLVPGGMSCSIDLKSLPPNIQLADGSSKNYKIFNEMLDDFDRQDVIDLHRLVNERYEITSPEGYDLLLWGDLKTLLEPNEEDEIWKNKEDYNLISCRLFDSCGVHKVRLHLSFSQTSEIEEEFGYHPPDDQDVDTRRNLMINKVNIKFRGGLLRVEGF